MGRNGTSRIMFPCGTISQEFCVALCCFSMSSRCNNYMQRVQNLRRFFLPCTRHGNSPIASATYGHALAWHTPCCALLHQPEKGGRGLPAPICFHARNQGRGGNWRSWKCETRFRTQYVRRSEIHCGVGTAMTMQVFFIVIQSCLTSSRSDSWNQTSRPLRPAMAATK